MQLKNNIRKYRDILNKRLALEGQHAVSQEELAYQAELSRSEISMLEREKTTPRQSTMDKVKAAFVVLGMKEEELHDLFYLS